MKRHRSAAIIFLLTLGVWRPAAAGEQKFLLRLGLTKQIYLVSEPIFATISLLNTGDTAISVRRLYLPYGYFKIIVKDSRGKIFPLLYESAVARDSARSARVEPEDSTSVTMDLLPLYAPGKREFRKMHTKTFLSPGSYTVHATFETGLGKSASGTASFSVRSPEGTERQVHELLARSTALEIKQQTGPATAVLDSIISSFPQSAYHVQAFMQKINLYELDDKPQGQRIACDAALALIDVHPESEATIPALSYYMIHSDIIGKTPTDIRETMKSILQKHPETRIAKQAYRVLKLYHAVEQ
jgi:hypothetical protein